MHPTTSAKARIGRSLVALGTIALLALPLAAPALGRESVDPATLNPAPPDFFNAVCERTGVQTICTLAFSDETITDEPSGIFCDDIEILFSQDRSVVGKRFYDADGNLTRRHFREYMTGSLTNPETGTTIWWDQHDTILHDLSTPGDVDSGTISFSGLISRFFTSSGQTVLVDSGTTRFDEGADELLHAGNNHPLDAYFVGGDSAALQPLCDALA